MNVKTKIIAGVCIGAVVISLFCIWNDSRHSADAAGSDVTRTVQQLETDSDTIGNQLDNAGTELQRGQAAASDAQGTVDDLSGRNQQSADIIDNSQQRLNRLKSQFADIDSANKLTETQAGSEGTSE